MLKSKGIEDDKVVEYQAAFQMFDVYNRGYFDENDLKELLSKFSAYALVASAENASDVADHGLLLSCLTRLALPRLVCRPNLQR